MTRHRTNVLFCASLAIAGIVLTGCGITSYGDEAREFVSENGARVADNTLENVEWYLCNAATIGSVRRKYGSDPQLADAYRALCLRPGDQDVIGEQAASGSPVAAGE